MEGGDHKEEVPQAVVPPEITEKEPDTIAEKPGDSQKSLTDSILDDDLVVIPSQTEIQQESSPTEQPAASLEPSPPSPPEPQAAVPASEPSQLSEPSETQPVAETPQPTIKSAQNAPVPPPQPNPETTLKTRPASATVRSANPTTKSKAVELEQEEDDDDFEDETLVERLIGLTEMFPETLCTVAGVTFSLSVSGIKKLFNFSRSALWIGSTSFMILILPIVFETEMVHMEQAQIQRQKQILLGPNAATAGGMTGGMTPPIPGVSVAAPPPEGR